MKILHFAVENYSNIPATLVQEERKAGHKSTLVTLYNNKRGYNDENYCLNLPFIGTKSLSALKKKITPHKRTITNKRRQADAQPIKWTPNNLFERGLIGLRDYIWEPKVRSFLKKIQIDTFDIIILDGGAGFLRNSKIIHELKESGKKIACCYYGSDLRTRGIIDSVDSIADVSFSFEFDHTLMRPDMPFLYFPFNADSLPEKLENSSPNVRIGHAPTNRSAKGSDVILAALSNLQKDHPIEIILIENMPYSQAIRQKATCDIFIDQIGELGYGVNSLESLAMGIPTAVELLPDFEKCLGAHPFVTINHDNINERLIPYIQSKKIRNDLARQGKEWVKKVHNAEKISQQILDTLQSGIINAK